MRLLKVILYLILKAVRQQLAGKEHSMGCFDKKGKLMSCKPAGIPFRGLRGFIKKPPLREDGGFKRISYSCWRTAFDSIKLNNFKTRVQFILCLSLFILPLHADFIIKGGTTKGNINQSNGVNFDVNNDGINDLIFHPSGNVGLGILLPSANLHVAGNLSLTGNLTSGLNKGLIGWWTFDEGSGNVLTDYSGHGHHGVITNGPIWIEGKYGYGLDYDGTNDYVDMGDPSDGSLDQGMNSFTMACWAKCDGSGNTGRLISKRVLNVGYELVPRNNVLSVFLGDGTDTFHADIGSTIITDNQWHHLAAVVDRSTEKITVYVDGIYDGEYDFTSKNIDSLNSNEPFKLGSKDSGQYYNGQQDDVRMYNRALTAQEIVEIYSFKSTNFAQGGTISGNTTFEAEISIQTLNLPSMTVPATPSVGDLYSTGSNILFYNSSNSWVSLIDLADTIWTLNSGNLIYDSGHLGVGSLSGAEITADNQSGSDNILDLYDNTDIAFSAQDGGLIGLGTASPGYNLDVSGNVTISSNLILSSSLTMAGHIFPSSNNILHVGSESNAWRYIFSKDFIAISDKRFKTEINDLENVDGIINQLKPVKYNWRHQREEEDIGLIAQDVLKVIPEAVAVPKQKSGLLGVKYQTLVPVIIQSQKDTHQNWKTKFKDYRKRLQHLGKRK